jgi:ribosomal protein S18 acetylase RimI-like enzyme
VSPIVDPEADNLESPRVIRAHPSMFKAFWPEVKGGYFFRSRRMYLDFLHNQGGKVFYLLGTSTPKPPFILIGNWRDREDIAAIWHIKARGDEKERLVLGAARECLDEGAEMLVSRLLDEREAREFGRWGFGEACKIILLEKQLREEPAPPRQKNGIEIVHFKKKAMDTVLKVDAAAFDDFWKLDARTFEAIAQSCYHNVSLLARREGEILGYIIGGSNGRLAYLQRLGVDLRHQGQGVGEFLAASLLHDLNRHGATVVMVNTQAYNQAALNLYHSLGFSIIPGDRFIMRYPYREKGQEGI